jgi:YHS domain-containing protein
MSSARKTNGDAPAPPEDDTVIDPVCGMRFQRRHAAGSAESGGRTYHFCSLSCARQFQEDVAAYAFPDHQGGGS